LLRAIVSRHDAPSGRRCQPARAPTVDQAFQRALVARQQRLVGRGRSRRATTRARARGRRRHRSRSGCIGPASIAPGPELPAAAYVSPTATLPVTRSASSGTRS
jgi:hypothetical protein